ncbi:MAG: GTP-binding protein [Clostridia bacterium]|nr:GTP-binding protein [Clostridia bacterium]
MIKIDLITGFLGSGKTTFIKKYVSYLVSQGNRVGILENDFGAVNVDMMLLQDIAGENVELEMVAGGCDYDCHVRRFKTKLISMYMSGYDRVIVEPSGIFDVDEFFDVLRESPLENWYEIGNVIAVVDAKLENNLSAQSEYMLASQLACAGKAVMSRTQNAGEADMRNTLSVMNSSLEKSGCRRRFTLDEIERGNWFEFSDDDFGRLLKSGYRLEDHVKQQFGKENSFDSLYYMNSDFTEDRLKDACVKLMSDESCGKVFRIKGFFEGEEGWKELNATVDNINISPVEKGQKIVIVIGENLNPENCDNIMQAKNGVL